VMAAHGAVFITNTRIGRKVGRGEQILPAHSRLALGYLRSRA
jgi:hypothetical protein